nr:hypothetical protein BaRGS_010425 [Batillaria attramentaria]
MAKCGGVGELRQREHVLLAGSPKLDRSKGRGQTNVDHLSKRLNGHRALIGWEPVNSRIITAKFITKKKDIKLNIIQCYAPTNDAEEEKKDDFYQQLQTVIDRGGAKDMTILMGDFNAKIGSDNTGYENTMGTHGLGQMNENGERFADFCALNQLVIGGSIFPHKRIHKATWRSPDHVTENQIDHICISRKFRRSWRDVRVMRGADAEIRKAIMTLRNGKLQGRNEIPAEAIKADHRDKPSHAAQLFSKIWEKEEVQPSGKKGIVIKLPKKGEPQGTAATTEGSCSCQCQARKLRGEDRSPPGMCLLSPFPLPPGSYDWIMRPPQQAGKNGIQWTLWTQLDDLLDFADDLALLSHSHSQMQDKDYMPGSHISRNRAQDQQEEKPS